MTPAQQDYAKWMAKEAFGDVHVICGKDGMEIVCWGVILWVDVKYGISFAFDETVFEYGHHYDSFDLAHAHELCSSAAPLHDILTGRTEVPSWCALLPRAAS